MRVAPAVRKGASPRCDVLGHGSARRGATTSPTALLTPFQPDAMTPAKGSPRRGVTDLAETTATDVAKRNLACALLLIGQAHVVVNG